MREGGGEEVAGAVVQCLSRKSARPTAVALDQCDAALRLDQAVEAGALGVRRAPGAELGDEQARIPCGERVGGEAQALQGRRTIAEHDGIRGLQEVVQRSASGIEQRGALAVTGVEMLPRKLGEVRRVDAEHVRAEEREGPGAHRTGDHPREVEDADAGEGSLPRRTGRRETSVLPPSSADRLRDRDVHDGRPPQSLIGRAVLRADGHGETSGFGDPADGLRGVQRLQRAGHGLRSCPVVQVQRGAKRARVVRVVAVCPDPSIRARPEPGEGRPHGRGSAAHLQIPVAPVGDGDADGVDAREIDTRGEGHCCDADESEIAGRRARRERDAPEGTEARVRRGLRRVPARLDHDAGEQLSGGGGTTGDHGEMLLPAAKWPETLADPGESGA